MSKTMNRRGFLGTGAAALGGLSALSGAKPASAIDAAFNTDYTPADLCFMDQYYFGSLDIVRGIRDTQLDKIAASMEKAYECIRKGGKALSHVNIGHYAMFAGSKDRPGQPWVLPHPGITPKNYDELQKGDFLLTSRAERQAQEARERGVHVVGVTNNYYVFAKTPPDGLREEKYKYAIEDVSDVVIDSQMPWDNGLVSAPQIPQLKLCPSSGIAQYAVYWACSASLANLIGTKGKGSSSGPALQYLNILEERFEMVGTDRPKIDWVAEKWTDLVLQKGARMLVYGHPQDVEPYDGARNIYVNDAYICSSSAMIADQYEKKANDVRDTDIVLIGGFTSDNSQEIEVARHARSIGAHTTAFCPYATDGDSSGVRLFKEAEYSFNTYSDESAGVISVKNFDEKVCPVAGLSGNLVMWMLTAQWTDHMCRRGEPPYYWKGYHERGGQEYDQLAHKEFLKRGY